MQRFLDSPRCRILALGTYLDGIAQFYKAEEGACDRYDKLGLVVETADKEMESKEFKRIGRAIVQAGKDIESGVALLREQEKKLEARRIRFVQNLDMV
jgi:hypothetical protein